MPGKYQPTIEIVVRWTSLAARFSLSHEATDQRHFRIRLSRMVRTEYLGCERPLEISMPAPKWIYAAQHYSCSILSFEESCKVTNFNSLGDWLIHGLAVRLFR